MKDDLPGTRHKALEMLTHVLQLPELARRIETSIFNFSLSQFPPSLRYWEHQPLRKLYCNKVLSMKFNLSDSRNPGLKERVENGTVTPSTLVQLHPFQLFPEHWEVLFESIAKRQLKRQLTTDPEQCPDGAFTCMCGSKKTVFTLLQTRSADEPTTAFIACISCGKRWKQ